MALVVEDGSGLSGAESYLSVADADAYLASYHTSAEWTAATTASKEQSLRKATQYLDAQFGGRFLGWRKTSGQALCWPRSGAVDDDGYLLGDSALPKQLKQATAELALRDVTQIDELLIDETDGQNIKAERVKVGSLEQSTEYQPSKSPQKRYTLVEGLLRPILEPTGEVLRA